MLLSVAAIDDAVALIGFGIATTIVSMMISNEAVSFLSVLKPFYEIGVSLLLGGAVSVILKLLFRWFKKASNRICIVAAGILLTYWLSNLVEGSELLACMALGGVLVNIFDDIESIEKVTASFTPPIFMIFFVISGAGFDVSALGAIGVIGVIYVVARVIGKVTGAWLGGTITKQEKKIRKYLGPTLMPQAGVALGLIVVAGNVVPQYASQIRTIILCSTFIYSIIGPISAKFALEKAGEIVIPKKNKLKSKKA